MCKTWLYAGTPGVSAGTRRESGSENPSGAGNQQGSLSDPSEATRRALYEHRGDDMVRTPWRHGELGRTRNDLAAKFELVKFRSNNMDLRPSPLHHVSDPEYDRCDGDLVDVDHRSFSFVV